jgi:hypothetical protein
LTATSCPSGSTARWTCPIEAEHLTYLLEGKRLDIVLEPAQLDDDVGRNDVRTGREQLAELDERRAELIQHLAQSTAPVGGTPVDRVALSPGDEVAQPVLPEEVPEPVTDRDLGDLGQTAEASLGTCLLDGHTVSVARVSGSGQHDGLGTLARTPGNAREVHFRSRFVERRGGP